MKSMSLYLKLTLAFLLLAFTTAALVAVFIRVTSADRLFRFVEEQQRSSMEEILVAYYATNQSWDGIVQQWGVLERVTALEANTPGNTALPQPDDFNDTKPGFHIRRFRFGLANADGAVLVSINPAYPTGSVLPAGVIKAGSALTVDGQQVGTILTDERDPGLNPAEAMFLLRTNQALLLSMAAAMVLALVAGLLLARTLTRPLHALTVAAQNIAAGKLEQQVQVRSGDEIGQLGTAFNRMSQEVARSNQLRRQMTADIAHDLRTPLTVIAGYVESMRDGVLKPTSQRFDLIYTEIDRLQNLVGDLRMLSQADSGELRLNPQDIDPASFLNHAAEIFQHHADQQQVEVAVETDSGLPTIHVDEARMMQVMDNLLSNALRYTPAGGKITLAARAKSNAVEINVSDTGSGIPADELPHIFDRFHRVDKSRHNEGDESGLGLAIVRALVEAHGGQVWAESQQTQGTTVRILIPAAVK